MSGVREKFEDSGEMSDCQLKFLRSLSIVLNENQNVLPTLPEMCERMITAQTHMPKEPHDKSNFDLFREDAISVLEKRKQGDLVKLLNEELAKKDKRISELLSHYKSQEERHKSSNDKYIAEIRAKEDELKESRKRETPLDEKPTSNVSVSTMTDIGGKEDSERFEEMEKRYQEMTLKGNEELKNLQHSYQQMEKSAKSTISIKDEELNQMKLREKELKEQCQALLGSKDEELREMKMREKELREQCQALLGSKDEELREMKMREKELKEQCKALLGSKDEELREMKMRLAHLSEKLVKKDQRKVEDTAAANRPSEVEKDFAAFFDNERMDAIEKMQTVYGSEEENDIGISYPRLACMIFEYKLSSHRVTLKISTYSQELKYPTEVLDALMLSLKETAHLCSLESMKEDVRRKVTEKWASWLASEKSCKFSFSNHLLFQLKDYVQACILLSWRMVVQVPPMQLEYRCTTLKNFHRKVGYHSSPEMCSRPPPNGQGAAGDEIACYLWPALLDGGGRVIRPGEVLCKVEAEAI